MQWVPLVRRIQAAGKCVQLLARPGGVEGEREILLQAVALRGEMSAVKCEDGSAAVRSAAEMMLRASTG